MLNDEGAKIIGQSMQKYGKISGIRLLNCVLQEDGLYSILEQGHNLKILDITGCLLCCSGEAFARHDYELIRSGVLERLRELRMSVVSCDRLALKNQFQKVFGSQVRLVFDGIKVGAHK